MAHINAWWTKHPDALVGVVCGERSGILAVDIDSGDNKCGEASFAATGLTIPKTVQTRTMSGGRHIFFKYPTGTNIRNSASTCFGKDVDVRAEGGYVIFAGSVLPDGRRYEYAEGLSIEEVEIAPLPDECNDPAESAQFRPLMHMPERVFSWQALGEGVCGCRS